MNGRQQAFLQRVARAISAVLDEVRRGASCAYMRLGSRRYGERVVDLKIEARVREQPDVMKTHGTRASGGPCPDATHGETGGETRGETYGETPGGPRGELRDEGRGAMRDDARDDRGTAAMRSKRRRRRRP